MNLHELRKMTDSFMAVRILQVAVDLKLFDVLASESRTANGIAGVLKTEPGATELFCNALTGMGFLEKSEGRFSNTETAQRYLVTSSPLYWGWIVRHNSRSWNDWGSLEQSLRTGRPLEKAEEPEYTDEDYEAFIMGMHSIVTARGDAGLLVDKLGLDTCERMLDLGGGPGTFSIAFCQRHPQLKATVFDLSETEKYAQKNIGRYPEVAERINFVGGDFLEDDLPRGFDLVLVSNIIHSHDDAQNQKIVEKVYRSLNAGGKIVIKDHILNDDLTQPANGAIFSIHMLLHTGGRDYGFGEVEGWLKDAGFSNMTLLDLPFETPYEVVVGNK